MSDAPIVEGFYERKTGSIQYVVSDPSTGKAAIIDPVWDFDERAAQTCTDSAGEILRYVKEKGLTIEWLLDTHAHADHFSAVQYLKEKVGGRTAIGEKVVEVQKIWRDIYNLPADFPCDGSQWDHLFKDEDAFTIGNLQARVMLCPGHTLASITYVIGDAAFVHDTLMMPDSGTSRCDFPGGDARALYQSIQKILALSDETRVFVGHDYGRDGRSFQWESTVKVQKDTNIHLRGKTSEEHFVELRTTRDAELPLPALMLAALQVNIRGGRAPDSDTNGVRYLRIPLNKFDGVSEVRGRET